MNERYDRQTAELRTSLQATREREQLNYETDTLRSDVRAHIASLTGREGEEGYDRNLLDSMTVYPDRRVAVRLNLLPRKWQYVLDSLAKIRQKTSGEGCLYDPSVPISVSRPLSSSKGME